MYWVQKWGTNITKILSHSLRQAFADHICSTVIMTEEAGADGFTHGFIPLPALCLHNAFLNSSEAPPCKRAYSQPSQSQPCIVFSVSLASYDWVELNFPPQINSCMRGRNEVQGF